MIVLERQQQWCYAQLQDSALQPIAEKVFTGVPLSAKEGLVLLQTNDRIGLAQLADTVRQMRVGQRVRYTTTAYVHPTNLCTLSCPLCSYYAKPGDAHAWLYTPEEALEKLFQKSDFCEVHIVGGLWPEVNLPYYQALFEGIKDRDSTLHIKGLTPVEYDYLSTLHGLPIPTIFAQMRAWGLGSIPGGGAEIFNDAIRNRIAPQKINTAQFLAIHEQAHAAGIPSNMTMLFGHVEAFEDIIHHLLLVRELQERTGMLHTFIPLKYHVGNNALGKRKKWLQPKDPVKVVAVSRLMLHNIAHIKVLPNYFGVAQALHLLDAGGDDFGSTAVEEGIITRAKGEKFSLSGSAFAQAIRARGREPYHVHSGAW